MYVIKSNRKTNSYTVRKINRITKVVRVGRRGLQGEQGPPGNDGADGVDGSDGVIQSIVAGDNITVDNTDPANPVVSSTASGGGGGGMELVTTVVADGTSQYLTATGLSLDDDNHYHIEVIFAPQTDVYGVAFECNSDTTVGNYRTNWWYKGGTAVAVSNVSSNTVHATVQYANTPTSLQMELRKLPGSHMIGEARSNRGSIGLPDFRMYAIGWIGTANVTDFHLRSNSGEVNISSGTIMKVYKL